MIDSATVTHYNAFMLKFYYRFCNGGNGRRLTVDEVLDEIDGDSVSEIGYDESSEDNDFYFGFIGLFVFCQLFAQSLRTSFSKFSCG